MEKTDFYHKNLGQMWFSEKFNDENVTSFCISHVKHITNDTYLSDSFQKCLHNVADSIFMDMKMIHSIKLAKIVNYDENNRNFIKKTECPEIKHIKFLRHSMKKN